MHKKELEALAREAPKSIKTESATKDYRAAVLIGSDLCATCQADPN